MDPQRLWRKSQNALAIRRAGWTNDDGRSSRVPEMMLRRNFLTLCAAAVAPSQSAAAGGDDIFHVAIFRFAKESVDDAMTAFRALASASRQESGNRGCDIYRGIDDDPEFCVVEHWASPVAQAAHERTEAFINFGQGVLAPDASRCRVGTSVRVAHNRTDAAHRSVDGARSQAPSGPTNDPFSIAPRRTAIRAAVFYLGPQQFEIIEAQVSHGHMNLR
jgi:quinol monooxygenase YgiN